MSFILLSAIFVSCGSGGKLTNRRFETPECPQGMPINATFLDEISWDIPHQNWGVEEWDRDFRAMRDMGINDSMIHVDFMIGSEDLDITGITYDGKKIPVFRNGSWCF